MPQELNFRNTFEVVLDATGGGSINFRPSVGSWLIKQVAASTSTNVNEPEFTASINGSFVGGSYSGSKTNDTTFDQTLDAQEVLTGTWTGGDVGATATMTISGVKTV